jgi:hypothetical protein
MKTKPTILFYLRPVYSRLLTFLVRLAAQPQKAIVRFLG